MNKQREKIIRIISLIFIQFVVTITAMHPAVADELIEYQTQRQWISLEHEQYVNWVLFWKWVLFLGVIYCAILMLTLAWNRRLAREVAHRKKAEQALRESEEKYRVLFHSFPLGITVSDNAGAILETNSMAEQLLEVPQTEHEQRNISGQEWQIINKDGTLMPVDEYPGVRALRENKLIKNEVIGVIKGGGDTTWLSITAAPIPMEKYGIVATYHDITVRKRNEEQIKIALQEKTVLLRELYHRTKNNMQVIRSMIDFQTQNITAPKTLAIFQDLKNKIQSMALVHQKLYQSKDLSNINLAEYFSELKDILLESYKVQRVKISVDLDLQNVNVLIDVAIPCGLILNELISNSLKYAFPGKGNGKIGIRLRRNDQSEIVIHFSDNGVGVPKGFNFRQSNTLGLTTIFGLAEHQLRGTVSFQSDNGISCLIRFQPDRLYGERI